MTSSKHLEKIELNFKFDEQLNKYNRTTYTYLDPAPETEGVRLRAQNLTLFLQLHTYPSKTQILK